jgi:hypothetical protein
LSFAQKNDAQPPKVRRGYLDPAKIAYPKVSCRQLSRLPPRDRKPAVHRVARSGDHAITSLFYGCSFYGCPSSFLDSTSCWPGRVMKYRLPLKWTKALSSTSRVIVALRFARICGLAHVSNSA